jgi:hypothetical protein
MNECIDSTMDRIHVVFTVLRASDDPRTSCFIQEAGGSFSISGVTVSHRSIFLFIRQWSVD